MTTSLDDVRERLDARAATTPLEVAAARNRLDGRLVRAARPSRRPRRVLVAAVAAVTVGVLAATAVAVLQGRSTTTGPATGAPAAALPFTNWLFTVRSADLPADLDVVQYGFADRDRQIAAVLRPGDAATSNHVSALVELIRDPAEAGIADPAPGAVPDGDGWSGPTVSEEFGVSGTQVVWTDPSGYTMRAVATDLATARTLRDATEVGVTHPVRFPATVPAGFFPDGSRIRTLEYSGTQGIDLVVDVPGDTIWRLSVAAPGIYLDNARESGPVTTTPLGAGFSNVSGPSAGDAAVLTSATADVRVIVGHSGYPSAPPPSLDHLRALVVGARFATVTLHPDPDRDGWFALADALPIT